MATAYCSLHFGIICLVAEQLQNTLPFVEKMNFVKVVLFHWGGKSPDIFTIDQGQKMGLGAGIVFATIPAFFIKIISRV